MRATETDSKGQWYCKCFSIAAKTRGRRNCRSTLSTTRPFSISTPPVPPTPHTRQPLCRADRSRRGLPIRLATCPIVGRRGRSECFHRPWPVAAFLRLSCTSLIMPFVVGSRAVPMYRSNSRSGNLATVCHRLDWLFVMPSLPSPMVKPCDHWGLPGLTVPVSNSPIRLSARKRITTHCLSISPAHFACLA